MLIHVAQYQKSLAFAEASRLGASLGLHPARERSENSFRGRVREATAVGNGYRVFLGWHRDAREDPGWLTDFLGGNRGALGRRESRRLAMWSRLRDACPQDPVTSPSGPVDDTQEARELAVEAVDYSHSRGETQTAATVVISRQALHDRGVLSRMGPLPRGLTELRLAVFDTSGYPSVWSEEDWYEWLRLIHTHAQSGLAVIAAHSDVRGLVALAAGAADFGTGLQQPLRQLQTPSSSRGGPAPSVSYLSLPLLSVLHGENAAVAPHWADLESHRLCLDPAIPLSMLHAQGPSFDPGWLARGLPGGQLAASRLRQHLTALASAQEYLQSAPNLPRRVRDWCRNSAALAASLGEDFYKTAGSRDEVLARRDAFERFYTDFSLGPP